MASGQFNVAAGGLGSDWKRLEEWIDFGWLKVVLSNCSYLLLMVGGSHSSQ